MGTPLLLARLSQVAEVMLSFRQTLARFRNEYKRLHYSPPNCDRTVYIFSVSRLVRWQFVVTRSSLTVAQRSAIYDVPVSRRSSTPHSHGLERFSGRRN